MKDQHSKTIWSGAKAEAFDILAHFLLHPRLSIELLMLSQFQQSPSQPTINIKFLGETFMSCNVSYAFKHIKVIRGPRKTFPKTLLISPLRQSPKNLVSFLHSKELVEIPPWYLSQWEHWKTSKPTIQKLRQNFIYLKEAVKCPS